MKSMVRNLRSLTLVFAMIAAAGVTPSSALSPQNTPDPACISTCAGLLFECLSSGGKNNDHACISVYRHCLAQCGKH